MSLHLREALGPRVLKYCLYFSTKGVEQAPAGREDGLARGANAGSFEKIEEEVMSTILDEAAVAGASQPVRCKQQ
ncbi:hypothetical protein R1flu_013127, partial [Riccia fluitans]